MTWTWALADLTGATTAFVVPRKASITRRLNGASSTVLTLDGGQAERAVLGRLVKGWREPAAGGALVLRASGQIQGLGGNVRTDDLEAVEVTAHDAFEALSARELQAAVEYLADTPRAIADAIIDAQDARRTVGLYLDPSGDSGPPRDRTYERGKNAGEAVAQLAEVDDGFYFRVDPYEGTRDGYALFSELVILYPESGSDRPGARFEYGVGTLGNLGSAEVNALPPVNYVTAFGAGETGSQLIETATDAASVAAYGLRDASLNLTDVSIAETLAQHALDALRPDPQVTYRVTATDNPESLPRPWDDFDVGDIVRVRVTGDSPAVAVDASARVTGFTVEIDENGSERLTELTMEDV